MTGRAEALQARMAEERRMALLRLADLRQRVALLGERAGLVELSSLATQLRHLADEAARADAALTLLAAAQERE